MVRLEVLRHTLTVVEAKRQEIARLEALLRQAHLGSPTSVTGGLELESASPAVGKKRRIADVRADAESPADSFGDEDQVRPRKRLTRAATGVDDPEDEVEAEMEDEVAESTGSAVQKFFPKHGAPFQSIPALLLTSDGVVVASNAAWLHMHGTASRGDNVLTLARTAAGRSQMLVGMHHLQKSRLQQKTAAAAEPLLETTSATAPAPRQRVMDMVLSSGNPVRQIWSQVQVKTARGTEPMTLVLSVVRSSARLEFHRKLQAEGVLPQRLRTPVPGSQQRPIAGGLKPQQHLAAAASSRATAQTPHRSPHLAKVVSPPQVLQAVPQQQQQQQRPYPVSPVQVYQHHLPAPASLPGSPLMALTPLQQAQLHAQAHMLHQPTTILMDASAPGSAVGSPMGSRPTGFMFPQAMPPPQVHHPQPQPPQQLQQQQAVPAPPPQHQPIIPGMLLMPHHSMPFQGMMPMFPPMEMAGGMEVLAAQNPAYMQTLMMMMMANGAAYTQKAIAPPAATASAASVASVPSSAPPSPVMASPQFAHMFAMHQQSQASVVPAHSLLHMAQHHQYAQHHAAHQQQHQSHQQKQQQAAANGARPHPVAAWPGQPIIFQHPMNPAAMHITPMHFPGHMPNL